MPEFEGYFEPGRFEVLAFETHGWKRDDGTIQTDSGKVYQGWPKMARVGGVIMGLERVEPGPASHRGESQRAFYGHMPDD